MDPTGNTFSIKRNHVLFIFQKRLNMLYETCYFKLYKLVSDPIVCY